MTRAQFAIFLQGLFSAKIDATTAGGMALDAAAAVLAFTPPKAELVGLTALKVPQFCIHNVNLKERCHAGCPAFSSRIFAFALPYNTAQVYIRAHDRTPGNEDDAPAVPTAERSADA